MPLALSRQPGGKIFIGDNIVVEVVSVDPRTGSVRLRISAPGLDIKREELLDFMAQARFLEAAGHAPKSEPEHTDGTTSPTADKPRRKGKVHQHR